MASQKTREGANEVASIFREDSTHAFSQKLKSVNMGVRLPGKERSSICVGESQLGPKPLQRTRRWSYPPCGHPDKDFIREDVGVLSTSLCFPAGPLTQLNQIKAKTLQEKRTRNVEVRG
eukprot:CAMPEP_0198227402 /NCGR_PEP_ID=MMETSP1445-20131203/109085_1 /TAXON_ID=36898 /ORGANISM="Pyramimonas sp., Strain CCMP2087" /LENGTH=118 /DNA_ID=CAMNT_0043907439 /DNA_START=27 /DNA_END=383 /DNA_ORIENTATION=-